MTEYIACDMHKRYSLFGGMGETGRKIPAVRVEHTREAVRAYLERLPPGTAVAVETTGNWYWMVEEIEAMGHVPRLTHAGKAKLMMGQRNKTDALDVVGLATLMRAGTLPTVWIPPGALRDQRELLRLRMVMGQTRTRVKNRIHATLAKYALVVDEVSDLFGVRGRELLAARLGELPPETRRCVEQQLEFLDQVEGHLEACEERLQEVLKETPEMALVRTLPGVGRILSAVLVLEIGTVERFAGPENLASYAGTVPRVHASGGKVFYGRVRRDVNRYLKWAYVEASNSIVMQRSRMGSRHVVRLYTRIRQAKGHGKAVVAVARHLAEATYWVLKTRQPYRDPRCPSGSSTPGQARNGHESDETR